LAGPDRMHFCSEFCVLFQGLISLEGCSISILRGELQQRKLSIITTFGNR
jgi:hypothetical protein